MRPARHSLNPHGAGAAGSGGIERAMAGATVLAAPPNAATAK